MLPVQQGVVTPICAILTVALVLPYIYLDYCCISWHECGKEIASYCNSGNLSTRRIMG